MIISKATAAGDGTGSGRIARTGQALVFGLLQQLQAMGLDIPTVLSQLGVNGEKLAAGVKPASPRAEETEMEVRGRRFTQGSARSCSPKGFVPNMFNPVCLTGIPCTSRQRNASTGAYSPQVGGHRASQLYRTDQLSFGQADNSYARVESAGSLSLPLPLPGISYRP